MSLEVKGRTKLVHVYNINFKKGTKKEYFSTPVQPSSLVIYLKIQYKFFVCAEKEWDAANGDTKINK